jgi:hypothetical protein
MDAETPNESRPKQNTYVIDPENAGELARLMHQDQMLTRGMGGLFPEFPEGAPLPAGGASSTWPVARAAGRWKWPLPIPTWK